MSCYRDTQLEMSDNYLYYLNFRPDICEAKPFNRQCRLYSFFYFLLAHNVYRLLNMLQLKPDINQQDF